MTPPTPPAPRRLLAALRETAANGSAQDIRALLWLLAARLAEARGLLPSHQPPREAFLRLADAAHLDHPSTQVNADFLHEINRGGLHGADVAFLGEAYTSLMAGRRTHGSYYTPPALAGAVARLTLAPLLPDSKPYLDTVGATHESLLQTTQRIRVIDPAMGSGNLLLAAAEILAPSCRAAGFSEQEARQRALSHLYGVDSDPLAVELARIGLWLWSGAPVPADHFACANALLDELRGGSLAPPFDAVLGNPPFASVFTRARSVDDQAAAIRARYVTAQGSYDLAVPFVELAIRLCRAGGRVGLVLPNKILAAEYARPLREWLSSHAALEAVIDASRERPFRASVYPVACVWRTGRPQPEAQLDVFGYRAGKLLSAVRRGKQSELHASAAGGWSGILDPDWDILRRCFERSIPLGKIAALCAGLTVGEAYGLRASVFDADSDDLPQEIFRLITSGLIRPFCSTWGKAPARFLKSSYRRPAVPALALPPRRLAQTRRKKLIVAGMGLAPRAMLDEGHSQASVATVILADSSWPLGALCALINSRLTGRLCRAMLGGLALGGGHLRFGKRELARLPVPDVPPSDPRVGKLDGLAGDDNKVEIDALVCQMFGVDEDVLNDSRRNGT